MNSPPFKKLFSGQEPATASTTETMKQVSNRLWRSKIEELNDTIVKALNRFEADDGYFDVCVGQKAIVRNKVTVNFRKISHEDTTLEGSSDQGLMLYFAIRPSRRRHGGDIDHGPRHKGTILGIFFPCLTSDSK